MLGTFRPASIQGQTEQGGSEQYKSAGIGRLDLGSSFRRQHTINGGLQHFIGKEVSRFEQGKDDFIENIDDECIHYGGGRVAANESLLEPMNQASLRQFARRTGLHKETIIAIRRGQKLKLSTLAKVVMGLRDQQGD